VGVTRREEVTDQEAGPVEVAVLLQLHGVDLGGAALHRVDRNWQVPFPRLGHLPVEDVLVAEVGTAQVDAEVDEAVEGGGVAEPPTPGGPAARRRRARASGCCATSCGSW